MTGSEVEFLGARPGGEQARRSSLSHGGRTCLECRRPLPPRRKKFCSDPCRYRYRDRFPSGSKRLTCASCGTAIWKGTGSLRQGEATCRPCRRSPEKRSGSLSESASKLAGNDAFLKSSPPPTEPERTNPNPKQAG